MGSEMCMRDRSNKKIVILFDAINEYDFPEKLFDNLMNFIKECNCLLYTSDAADERSSVDLGGRRIIKKKTTKRRITVRSNNSQTTL